MKVEKIEYRWDVINFCIQKYGYTDYLEIGLQASSCFNRVNCKNKYSVDPDNSRAEPTYHMTSDEFFEQNEKMYDIVLIDGNHVQDFVYRDIANSLRFLKENGRIICHDFMPVSKESETVPRIQAVWHGSSWAGGVQTRIERDDIEMFTINCDEGLGVIKKSKNKVKKLDVKLEDLTYDNFDANRVEWLNLISPEEALKRL